MSITLLGNETVKLEKEGRAEEKGIRLTKSKLGIALVLTDENTVCGSIIENNLVSSMSPTQVRFLKIVSMEWPQFTAKLLYEQLTSRGKNNRWRRNKIPDSRVILLGTMFFRRLAIAKEFLLKYAMQEVAFIEGGTCIGRENNVPTFNIKMTIKYTIFT
jgi:hypothetical protein